MIAFEVIVNGKKVCTAGIQKLGNLCAHVDWCVGQQVAPSTGFTHESNLLQLTVAGVNVRYKPKKAPHLKPGFRYTESVDWVERKIRPGDEVIIRVVEAARVSRPRKRKRLL